MASPGSAWSFWKTVQTVSPKEIEEEASAAFKLAIVGLPADRKLVREALLTERATVLERDEAENHLREFETAPDADTSRAFAFTIYAGPSGEPTGVRGYNSVPFTGTGDEIVAGMLARRPDLAVAFARRLPRFRVPACNLLIQGTSRVNAGVALISALPGVLPITGIILPATSVGDVILLTKNQIILVMRLAAAHGQKSAYTKQVKEILATVGGALGWRTVARELVGLVPAGIGAALKAGIAYSGTVAVGKAALFYYQTGKKATPAQIREAYDESQDEAKRAVEALKQ
ncbi:MAG: hypothetical protein H7Z41_17365 [Cytophagales bacterium]|nr:hypothetical protein [Armatimonadota bacterium]